MLRTSLSFSSNRLKQYAYSSTASSISQVRLFSSPMDNSTNSSSSDGESIGRENVRRNNKQQQGGGGGWRAQSSSQRNPQRQHQSGSGSGKGGGGGTRDRLAEFLSRHDAPSPSPSPSPSQGGGGGRTSWRTTTSTRGNHPNLRRSNNQQQQQQRKNQKNENTTTNKPLEDLRDISHLRSAFLRSVKLDRERRISSPPPPPSSPPSISAAAAPPPPKNESKLEKVLRESAQKRREEMERRGLFSSDPQSSQTSSQQPMDGMRSSVSGGGGGWRSNAPRYTGTKAFRERKKERQQNTNNNQNYRQQQQRSSNLPRYNAAQDGFNYNQQQQQRRRLQEEEEEERKQKQRQQRQKQLLKQASKEKVITLPSSDSISLGTLSKLYGIKMQSLLHTLQNSLGEEPMNNKPEENSKENPSNNVSEYKIDMEVAELLGMEFGLTTEKKSEEKNREGDVTDVVELAERRLMRDSNEKLEIIEDEAYELLPPRPPVVCIMGHVDHGKTTLMDALRRMASASTSSSTKTRKEKGGKKGKKGKKKKAVEAGGGGKKNNGIVGDMAGTEAGGITQIISAFQVALPSSAADDEEEVGTTIENPAVTFLDTPGHAAFKSMRQSGSNATDVMVLVIAADDGVSPQTVEILDTYKSIIKAQPGSISLMIAMTKIDKFGVDVDESIMRIENKLLEHGIMTENLATGSTNDEEEYGPPVQLVPISAITGDGLEDLVESLILQSEVMDLRANKEDRAEGIVMDARMDKGLGVVVDCIVRWGKLEKGDVVVSGMNIGKVKILSDVNGNPLKKGMPSQPVRIVGFKSLPKAGDPIVCVESEEVAKELVSKREAAASMSGDSSRADVSNISQPELQITGMESKQAHLTKRVHDRYGLNQYSDELSSGDNAVHIPVIIKADADGTLEAVRDAILSIGAESKLDLCIDPVGLSIGPITTTDVRMASESGAPIFVFGGVANGDNAAMSLAESEDVTICSHKVIYHLLDDAKDVFASFFPPVPVEKVHGSAYVQAIFDVNNKKNAERIAGLKVQEGTLYKEYAESDSDKLECYFRVLRNGNIVSDGDKLVAGSLRKVKDDVNQVKRGEDCGLGLAGFKDFEEGDIIECYSIEMKKVNV